MYWTLHMFRKPTINQSLSLIFIPAHILAEPHCADQYWLTGCRRANQDPFIYSTWILSIFDRWGMSRMAIHMLSFCSSGAVMESGDDVLDVIGVLNAHVDLPDRASFPLWDDAEDFVPRTRTESKASSFAWASSRFSSNYFDGICVHDEEDWEEASECLELFQPPLK